MTLTTEIRSYLKSITDNEAFLQLLQHLVYSANEFEEDSEAVWQRRLSFCEEEVLPNLEFMISVVKEERQERGL